MVGSVMMMMMAARMTPYAARNTAPDRTGNGSAAIESGPNAGVTRIPNFGQRRGDHQDRADRLRAFYFRPLLSQSSSTSRFTAGAFGFFILSQSFERPDR